PAMLAEASRTGSARGLVAAYSTLGLLKLRLGALPDADAAARVALRVLREGDFAPGLAFAVTVLADVALEAGEPPPRARPLAPPSGRLARGRRHRLDPGGTRTAPTCPGPSGGGAGRLPAVRCDVQR